MTTQAPEGRTLEQERNSMKLWGALTVITGGAALADLAIEGGLAAVPGLGWIADVFTALPAAGFELGFDVLFIISLNKFLHHRHEVRKQTGKAHPESKPPQIPLGPRRLK